MHPMETPPRPHLCAESSKFWLLLAWVPSLASIVFCQKPASPAYPADAAFNSQTCSDLTALNPRLSSLDTNIVVGAAGMRHPHTGLVGNTLHVDTRRWVRYDSSTGAGIDSFYEYLLKARCPAAPAGPGHEMRRAMSVWGVRL